jgi:hypothetical protein
MLSPVQTFAGSKTVVGMGLKLTLTAPGAKGCFADLGDVDPFHSNDGKDSIAGIPCIHKS